MREEKWKKILVHSGKCDNNTIFIELIFIEIIFQSIYIIGFSLEFHTKKLVLPEPIEYSQFEFFESDRLDKIVTRSEVKCLPEYVYLWSSTEHYDGNIHISFSNQLYDLKAPEFVAFFWKLEISEDNIISRDEMEFIDKFDRRMEYSYTIRDNLGVKYICNLCGKARIVFYDEDIHIIWLVLRWRMLHPWVNLRWMPRWFHCAWRWSFCRDRDPFRVIRFNDFL